jgi:subtilisin family serine protease
MDRRRSRAIAVSVVLLVGGLALHAQDSPLTSARQIRPAHRRVPGRYIVVLRGNDDPEAVGLESARLHKGKLRKAYRHALRGFAVEVPEAAARALAQDPRVAYVEEDGVTTATAMSEQVNVESWGIDRIDQRLLPFEGRYRYAADGSGVNVYIMDTGVRASHGSFEGRVFGAYSAIADGIPPDQDCVGHGTHVAGIVGSAFAGVAKNVTMHSVKALHCTSTGSWSEYVAAVDWVIAHHRKPAVINASIGGGFSQAAHDAIERAVASGITFVGSAGNDNVDACPALPGAATSALIVASSTAQDGRASYSNWGSCVDLFAPGDSILSLSSMDNVSYQSMSGTSMAAPQVAGAAALYLQRRPAALPAEVRKAIVGGATAGVINLFGAAGTPNLLLFTSHLGDIVAPTVSVTSPAPGAYVTGTVTISAAARDDVELTGVKFLVDGTTLGTDYSPPFSVAWDTTRFANAGHTVTVEARDLAGNVTRRAIAVSVVNDAGPQWTTTAVGTSGTGATRYSADALIVEGTGADIWGAADSFHFAHRRWSGDGDLIVNVASIAQPPDAQFAMAGIMFRESLQAGSRHAALVITTDGKLKFRRRTTTDGTTLSDGPAAGTTFGPRWLKLSRRGNSFGASISTDGFTWSGVHVPQAITMPATVDVGLVVLRKGGSGPARATFSNIGLGRVPDGWGVADVGDVGLSGKTTHSGGVFELRAAGTDLWSTEDALHLAYKPWTGDGEITARIEAVTAPADSSFALAAITMRESLEPDARHASLVLTTQGKAKFRRRTSRGGTTLSDGPASGSTTAPRWVRLKRQGHDLTAFLSADGMGWEPVAATQSVVMPPTIYIGVLALRSGGSETTTARFSSVTIR